MHVPLIWRPAPARGIASATVAEPVGHVDIAPTICAAAGLPMPDWMQGTPFPQANGEGGRERTITEWYDTWDGNTVELQTLYRDGWVLTRYGATNFYDGTEGELYNLADDPKQWTNLWADPARQGIKADLLDDLITNLPAGRDVSLEKVAPV